MPFFLIALVLFLVHVIGSTMLKVKRIRKAASYGPFAYWVKVPYEDTDVDYDGIYSVTRWRWELHFDPDFEQALREVNDFIDTIKEAGNGN